MNKTETVFNQEDSLYIYNRRISEEIFKREEMLKHPLLGEQNTSFVSSSPSRLEYLTYLISQVWQSKLALYDYLQENTFKALRPTIYSIQKVSFC